MKSIASNRLNKVVAGRTLVIIQSSLRGFDLTDLARRFVGLRNVDFDLAYCGSADEPFQALAGFQYSWVEQEEDKVGEFLRGKFPQGVWELFLDPDNQDGFSSTETGHQLWVSGLIQGYYRLLALNNIVSLRLTEVYSYFVFIRSDYLFLYPLPNFAAGFGKYLYFFEGESYGGVCDRFVAVPRELVAQFARIYDFSDLLESAALQATQKFIAQSPYKNPETLLWQRLVHHQLIEVARSIRQRGFCIRQPSDSSRWTLGFYSRKRQLFVKYPTEFALARIGKLFLEIRVRSIHGRREGRPLTRRPSPWVRFVGWAGGKYRPRVAVLIAALGEWSLASEIWKQSSRKKTREIELTSK